MPEVRAQVDAKDEDGKVFLFSTLIQPGARSSGKKHCGSDWLDTAATLGDDPKTPNATRKTWEAQRICRQPLRNFLLQSV